MKNSFRDQFQAAIRGAGGSESPEPSKDFTEAELKEFGKMILSEQATSLAFLRGSLPKLSGAIEAAAERWKGLDEKKQKSTLRWLTKVGVKAARELKRIVSDLKDTSDPKDIMLVAMIVYLFGLGVSGEGKIEIGSEE